MLNEICSSTASFFGAANEASMSSSPAALAFLNSSAATFLTFPAASFAAYFIAFPATGDPDALESIRTVLSYPSPIPGPYPYPPRRQYQIERPEPPILHYPQEERLHRRQAGCS